MPLLRPDVLFDRQLAESDRGLFAGNDPAELVHALLGTGVLTHVLSAAYVAFILFLPGWLGLALVFSRNLQAALFYTTAQSLNWVFGIASYLLLRRWTHLRHAGRVREPARFGGDAPAGRPARPAGRLPGGPRDGDAAEHRGLRLAAHLDEPDCGWSAVYLLGLGTRWKVGLWIWFALTNAATIYFGWHYVLDNVGGVLVCVLALVLARALTGIDLQAARSARRPTGTIGRSGRDAEERHPGTPVLD